MSTANATVKKIAATKPTKTMIAKVKSTPQTPAAASKSGAVKKLPKRSQVKPADTWDLASLFADDEAWEKAFTKWESEIAGYEEFRGKLGDGAKTLWPPA